MTISGTKEINGVTAVVSRQSNPRNIMDVDEYLLKNSQGVTYLDNDDRLKRLQSIFSSGHFLHSQPDGSFVQANKARLDYGSDLDGDAKNETVDLKSIVNVKGLETVTVPAGIFPNSVRIETDLTLTVTLSSNKEKSSNGNSNPVACPGIGPVKTVTATSANGLSETESEELTAAIIAATFLRPATSLTAGSMPNSVTVRDINNGLGYGSNKSRGWQSKGFQIPASPFCLGMGPVPSDPPTISPREPSPSPLPSAISTWMGRRIWRWRTSAAPMLPSCPETAMAPLGRSPVFPWHRNVTRLP